MSTFKCFNPLFFLQNDFMACFPLFSSLRIPGMFSTFFQPIFIFYFSYEFFWTSICLRVTKGGFNTELAKNVAWAAGCLGHERSCKGLGSIPAYGIICKWIADLALDLQFICIWSHRVRWSLQAQTPRIFFSKSQSYQLFFQILIKIIDNMICK
jgi:hypothetical protein